MIISFVGPREPGNYFKAKVAEQFDCPVVSFNDLSKQLFEELNHIYGLKNVSMRTADDFHLMVRERITKLHPKFYMDWMITQLTETIFRKTQSLARNVQCVVLDVETHWEYRVLSDFGLSAKNMRKRPNKFILIENDAVKFNWYNEGKEEYLNWDVDGVISEEDEDFVKEIERLKKAWYVVT